MTKYDLLIKGGFLVDPVNDRQGRFDVGLSGDRVAAVEAEISPDRAREVYDAAGKLVLPGLVDTHVHLTPLSRAVGFAPNRDGLLAAARSGYMCVQKRAAQGVVYLAPEAGVAHAERSSPPSEVQKPWRIRRSPSRPPTCRKACSTPPCDPRRPPPPPLPTHRPRRRPLLHLRR